MKSYMPCFNSILLKNIYGISDFPNENPKDYEPLNEKSLYLLYFCRLLLKFNL